MKRPYGVLLECELDLLKFVVIYLNIAMNVYKNTVKGIGGQGLFITDSQNHDWKCKYHFLQSENYQTYISLGANKDSIVSRKLLMPAFSAKAIMVSLENS